MKVKIYFHVLTIALTPCTFAQSSSTLMGARAAGLGYTAVTLEDEWALFNNAAGLARVDKMSTAFAYEVSPALTGANRTAASVVVPSKLGTLGVGIFRFGDDLYSEHLLSVGFGNQIGNTSLGVKINYTQYRAENFGTSTAASVDFGGITRITSQFSVGARITNLTQSKLNGTVGERLPAKLAVGVGFRPSEKIVIGDRNRKGSRLPGYLAKWGGVFDLQKSIFSNRV